ncbi:rhamnolipids biosynthesis 3-oxoacyl-reductase [Cladochytrium replicatum]|nr:rhamnolipids biosynthesis 3-oxoacyl-reductase [Cladochytrium replicatum]
MNTIPDLTIPRLFVVKGKVALVTGGGTGIGLMYIASRKLPNLQKVADNLNALAMSQKSGGECIPLQANLVSRADCEATAAKLKEREQAAYPGQQLGHELGCAAGGFQREGWCAFYLTTSLIPLLEAAGKTDKMDPARVINVSSIAGSMAIAETPVAAEGSGIWSYNASKAALNHLTRGLAYSLAGRSITVNAIAPGTFPSNMTRFGLENNGDLLAAFSPTGRIGAASDMAGLAIFLFSKASAHITGAVITIDGGQSLGAAKL